MSGPSVDCWPLRPERPEERLRLPLLLRWEVEVADDPGGGGGVEPDSTPANTPENFVVFGIGTTSLMSTVSG